MFYYIADPHFGHSNIIKLCNRPFNDIEEMNETIIKNWNDKVKKDDTVYIVGDFAYKDKGKAISIASRLNGHKILIEGNHDKHNLQSKEFRLYFDEIRQQFLVNDNGRMIFLCHYPVIEWDGYYRNNYHIYGHIHNSVNETYRNICQIDPDIRMLNCGADITNFTPVTFDELLEINKEFRKKFRSY